MSSSSDDDHYQSAEGLFLDRKMSMPVNSTYHKQQRFGVSPMVKPSEKARLSVENEDDFFGTEKGSTRKSNILRKWTETSMPAIEENPEAVVLEPKKQESSRSSERRMRRMMTESNI